MAARWTTPDDLLTALRRRWDVGELLMPAADYFPLHLPLRGPDPPELGRRFDEVDAWIASLQTHRGYELVFTTVTTRQLGTNRIPTAAVVSTHTAALALIGRLHEYARWCDLLDSTMRLCPALRPWALAQPLALLTHAAVWERALLVVAWFLAHPRPDCFARQVDLPGIDTKFIEQQSPLLRRLLEAVLPPSARDATSEDFAQRFGLRRKPTLIQIRVLDPRLAIGGLRQLAAPAEQLANLTLPVRRVFITENEMNGLTLPEVSAALVIFGRGYAVDTLARIPWLTNAEIHYWGDLDTHGFAILDRLRAHLPHVTSFLMDEATLLEHRACWAKEPTPSVAELTRLTDDEHAVYTGLRRHRWGERVRLEQERVGFGWVERAVAGITRNDGWRVQ